MPRSLAVVLVLLLACACREEGMTRVKSPKETPPAAVAARAAMGEGMGAGMGGGMSGAAQFPTAQTGGLSWAAPAGWKERPASGMRAGTLVPPTGDATEVAIFALPGDAGGELANVNRWRGQIGLPPLDEAALARARVTIPSPAGRVVLYDFTGEGAERTRLAAALLEVRGDSWFFKMTGPERSVGASLPAFKKMLSRLRAHDA